MAMISRGPRQPDLFRLAPLFLPALFSMALLLTLPAGVTEPSTKEPPRGGILRGRLHTPAGSLLNVKDSFTARLL